MDTQNTNIETPKTCTCGRNQGASLNCGLCKGLVCKSCVEFIQADAFSFMTKLPEELTHSNYCLFCYSTHIQPAIRTYNQTMKRAKDIIIIDKPSRKPLPILDRSVEPLLVDGCPDREETVLRLGFMAAERGYNAVIKANIAYKKVRNAGYQKMIWQGTGFPANLDAPKLEKQLE
jgi:hypothetical protein